MQKEECNPEQFILNLSWKYLSDDSVTSGSNIETINLKDNSEEIQMENEVDILYDNDGDYFNKDGAIAITSEKVGIDMNELYEVIL